MDEPTSVRIGHRLLGHGQPVFVAAELSANHLRDLDRAVALVIAAHEAGADAVKLQTYTAESMTFDSRAAPFRLGNGPWSEHGTLYDLYTQAATPREWHTTLRDLALELGMEFFSTPFDEPSVTFLDELGVPAFKIASFEIVDVPLLRAAARTGRPLILSTGMADLSEIEEALAVVRSAGSSQVVLLQCTSGYPTPLDEANLATLPDLATKFGVLVGLSDHTLGAAAAVVPVAAVALGACLVEKHLTLRRSDGGPDAGFSLEPEEFAAMVTAIRATERALGQVRYGVTESEADNRRFRRSLFVVRDMKAGDLFTTDNVRSIRPATGLHPRCYDEVMGRAAGADIPAGTPLSWELIRSRPS